MKKEWYKLTVVQIFFHLAAWGIFLLLPFLARPQLIENGRSIHLPILIRENILNCIFLAAIFYLNAYWLIPNLLNGKKKLWYIFSILVILSCSLLFTYFEKPPSRHVMIRGRWTERPEHSMRFDADSDFTSHFKEWRMEHPESERHMRPFPERNVFFFAKPIFPSIFIVIFILSVSFSYRFIIDKIRLENLEQQRRNERLKTELTFLRSQISPHFMFNILNSAVSLARTGSDQLEPLLIKLSGLMRYMLYDADDEKAPLIQELEYLESYIDLQKIRFGEDVQIEFTKTGVFFGHAIESMLLIPFVENAFKHGIGRISDPHIIIEVNQDNDTLTMRVANKFNLRRDEKKDPHSGIGLANVRKRLTLLYDDKFVLKVEEVNEWFEVNLKLMLR